MATELTIAGNFAGEKLVGYLAPAILEANTISKGLVTLHENFKKQLNIRSVDTTLTVGTASCSAPDAADVTVADATLTLIELSSGGVLCKSDFYSQWESLQQRGKRLGLDQIPMEFTDFVIDQLTKKIALFNEQKLWTGTTGAGSFEGFVPKLLAGDALPTDVDGTTLSAANIITELSKVYTQISNMNYDTSEGVLKISRAAASFYQQALGFGQIGASTFINSYNNGLTVGAKPLDFQGIRMEVCNGLGANTMVYSKTSDLHVGTNLQADYDANGLMLTDLTPIDHSLNFRWSARWAMGTQITNRADIIIYDPAVA